MMAFTNSISSTAPEVVTASFHAPIPEPDTKPTILGSDLTVSVKRAHRQTSMIQGIIISAKGVTNINTNIKSGHPDRSRSWTRKPVRSSSSFFRRLRATVKKGARRASVSCGTTHPLNLPGTCLNRFSRQRDRSSLQQLSTENISGSKARSQQICAALSGNPIAKASFVGKPLIRVIPPSTEPLSPTTAAAVRPRVPSNKRLLSPDESTRYHKKRLQELYDECAAHKAFLVKQKQYGARMSGMIVAGANREADLRRQVRCVERALGEQQRETSRHRCRANEVESKLVLWGEHLSSSKVQPREPVYELPAADPLHELRASTSNAARSSSKVTCLTGVKLPATDSGLPEPVRLLVEAASHHSCAENETHPRTDTIAPPPVHIAALPELHIPDEHSDICGEPASGRSAIATMGQIDLAPEMSLEEGDSRNDENEDEMPHVFYHLGESRIEKVPAIHRCPIPTTGFKHRGSVDEALLLLDRWEWCSIPDLNLHDPRLDRW